MARAHPSVDNLYGLLTAAAANDPDKPAVLDADAAGALTAVSYRQLKDRAEDYAIALDALGLDVGDRVMIEATTSAPSVAMLAACSLLGVPFVPVSPETPDNRVASIVESVEPALYVRGGNARKRAGLTEAVATARFDADGLGEVSSASRRTRPRHRREVTAIDTAYIIFTSGTTGRPKGVVMSHRSVVAFFRAVLVDGLVRPDDRIATTSPLHFDFALFDIGIALGGGATLVPIQREHVSSPRRMISLLRSARVTQIDGVPSIWRPIIRRFPELLGDLDTLRTILFAGEEFPLHELRRLQSVLPNVRMINGYGATESMACSFTEVPNPLPPDQERLSIAAVHTGAEVTLIGPDGDIVEEPGVPGEIYLRSPSLFSGYWNDPELTAEVLVPDPVDPRHGQPVLRTGDLAYRDEQCGLYFCGRVDSQVQIRGNRVELGEVETVLARVPGVQSAVAAAVPRAAGDYVLVAFVLVADSDFDERKARAFCEQDVPAYMVPRTIQAVTEFPLTANGKVDRSRLIASLPTHRRRQEPDSTNA